MPATEGVSEPSITLAINGAPHTLTVDVRTSLLDLLRERLP
jgi:aerobic-type carbon monoxide dehydrogenase small subunit (CoxS/CutS family)